LAGGLDVLDANQQVSLKLDHVLARATAERVEDDSGHFSVACSRSPSTAV
jgi:hypothetical protein